MGPADEVEGLVAGSAVGIGVDGGEVDLVAFRVVEIDDVATGPARRFRDGVEIETVGAVAADQDIAAEVTGEQVVPEAAFEAVIALAAAQRVRSIPALDG